MEYLEIIGGTPLSGVIRNSGSKNASLPILFASLMFNNPTVLLNVPKIQDVQTVLEILGHIGVGVNIDDSDLVRKVTLFPRFMKHLGQHEETVFELCGKMRCSILLLVPLLSRFGQAKIGCPGGCKIGARPFDVHLDGLKDFGTIITVDEKHIGAKLSNANFFKACEMKLCFPSVTGTEILVMAATAADGRSTIRNSAREPEVVDLCNFLSSKGALISGHGTSTVKIIGTPGIFKNNAAAPRDRIPYYIMPDRTEVITYIIAGAITKGEVLITDCRPADNLELISLIRKMGADITVSDNYITVCTKNSKLRCESFETSVYPGISTDSQAELMALCSLSQGNCHIQEKVYENRLHHVDELRKMGAKIEILMSNQVRVSGVEELVGAKMRATDLRAGAAVILAGLAAKGTSTFDNLGCVFRGYEDICGKLRSLGANVTLLEPFQFHSCYGKASQTTHHKLRCD